MGFKDQKSFTWRQHATKQHRSNSDQLFQLSILLPIRIRRTTGLSKYHLCLLKTVAVLTFIPSLPTVLMNAMVILAIKQKRELRRPSNILLSSLAVTDLVIGIIVMPLFVTVNFLIFQQVWSEFTCTLFLVNPCIIQLLFKTTLYHLTIIAWERYVAIQKWMDYKILVTNSRVKNLAIAAWISALFPAVPNLIARVADVNGKIIAAFFVMWSAEAATCLILIA